MNTEESFHIMELTESIGDILEPTPTCRQALLQRYSSKMKIKIFKVSNYNYTVFFYSHAIETFPKQRSYPLTYSRFKKCVLFVDSSKGDSDVPCGE